MWIRARCGVIVFCSLIGAPLSAQYAAHVVVTGGGHAGTYDLRRPSCTIDPRGQISLTDTSAVGHADRLASLVVASPAFVLEFGRDAAPRITPAGFSEPDASVLRGVGLLNLTWIYGNITFRGEIAGVARDGSDSVTVKATIACKGVKRLRSPA